MHLTYSLGKIHRITLFPKDFCEEVISEIEEKGVWFRSGGVGYTKNKWTNPTRTSEESWVERNGMQWIRDQIIPVASWYVSNHDLSISYLPRKYFYEMKAIRYKEGQFSKNHRDNPTFLSAEENEQYGSLPGYYHKGKEKLLTIIVYLNDNYDGGEIVFNEDDVTIKPGQGDMILFPPTLVHEAKKVTKGTKYILVTSLFK